ncbi:MAG: multiheme c-type cytochrome [Myxococcota bacterium]
MPVAFFASFAALLGIGASCGDNSSSGPTTPPPVERPSPDARIVLITDLKGYLEPCGCTSRPLGGIDRMAAKVASLTAEVPSVFVAAGDLYFNDEDHGGGRLGDEAETQELWKAETLAEILGDMGLVAAAPGALDLSHGLSTFQNLQKSSDFTLLSGTHRIMPTADAAADAGADAGSDADDGQASDGSSESLLSPTIVREVGPLKIGFFGVTDFGNAPGGVETLASPLEAAQSSVAALQQADVQVVVALVRGSRRDARRLGSEVDGIDFVIQAGLDEPEALAPSAAGSTVLLHAGRQGQGLVVLDLYHRGDGTFTDWSDWTVAEERAALSDRIEDLERRIRTWEEENRAAADVAQQRGRLARMKDELEDLQTPRSIEGNAFNARYEELPPDAERSAAVTRRVTAYDRRVNAHNQQVFASLTPEPAAEGAPHYVGSAACQSCHQAAFSWWEGHKHGIAYSTLEEQHKEFNLSCVGCHVTGYLEPGGSTVTHNLDGHLTNVGCESCHGPGSAHRVAPGEAGLVSRDTPEEVCVTCHNPEHSDTFVYEGYRAMLLVPGHGRPLE